MGKIFLRSVKRESGVRNEVVDREFHKIAVFASEFPKKPQNGDFGLATVLPTRNTSAPNYG
jgi:hypothetical protein